VKKKPSGGIETLCHGEEEETHCKPRRICKKETEGGESFISEVHQITDRHCQNLITTEFEWHTEPCDINDDVNSAVAASHESPGSRSADQESILLELSDQNDIPAENGGSLNSFLMHTMQGLKEIVKQGKGAARQGIKTIYAVKIRQKQLMCTQN